MAKSLPVFFNFLYMIPLYIVAFLVYLTPKRVQRRLLYLRDFSVGLFGLAFARFLPRLDFPFSDLRGKTAIVTGANSGVGLQIASDLARAGATVYLACRNKSKAQQAVQTLLWRLPDAGGRIFTLQLDTSSLDSVKTAALAWSQQEERKIDILVHNAGIPGPPADVAMTDEALEITYATNFLGSFLLTHFLEPYLGSDARVIFTSSFGQYGGKFVDDFSLGPVRGVVEPGFHCLKLSSVGGFQVASSSSSILYSQTKAMQTAFAILLQRRFDRLSAETGNGSHKLAFSFSPGYTSTPIFGKVDSRNFFLNPLFSVLAGLSRTLATDVDQGALTGTWLAMSDDIGVVENGGKYFDRRSPRLSSADAMNENTLNRLWTRWERDAGVEWR